MPDIDSMYHYLFSPLAWGLLLLVGLLTTWRWLPRWLRLLGVAMGLVFLLLCMPAGANLLVRSVESSAAVGKQCQDQGPAVDQIPIVVLSGGFEREPETPDDYAAFTPESRKRLQGAVRLWRSDPRRQLVISGGGPFAIKESTTLAALAVAWGVHPDRIQSETESMTTWENAEVLAAKLPRRIGLVTSAIHLPRALIAFRAQGFVPCAHASDSDYLPMDGPGYFMPHVSAMEKTETAVYEIAGMVEYRYRARNLAATRH